MADNVPIGGIIYRGGLLADIPVGYQLCDGTNGTPDLRDRFVEGAGGLDAPGTTGGSTEVVLGPHDHAAARSVDESISAVSPYQQAHWHESTDDGGVRDTDTDGGVATVAHAGIFPTNIENGLAHRHPFYVATDSSDLFYLANQPAGVNHHHTGSGTYASQSAADAGDQLPYFFALFYCQRLF